MSVKPFHYPIHPVDQVLFFLKSVGFARINHKLALYAIALKSPVQHLTLANRVGSIILTMQNKRRSARVFDKGHWRTSGEPLRFLVRQPVKPFIVSWPVFGAELCCEIAHARPRHSGLETIRLSNCPRSHVAAVRPAPDT